MTDINIKSFAEAVKSRHELSVITCVYGNSRELSQNPNCGFVLSFEVGKAKFSNDETQGFLWTKEYKLSLLAPTGASGKRLSEVAFWVAEALKDARVDGNLESVTIEKQHYNETTAVLYCEIVAVVANVKEAKVCKVYFNSKLQSGVTSLSSQSMETSVKSGELLNGYVEALEKYYAITIVSDRSLVLPVGAFEISLESDGYEDVYTSCVAVSEKCLVTASGMSYTYEIKGEK